MKLPLHADLCPESLQAVEDALDGVRLLRLVDVAKDGHASFLFVHTEMFCEKTACKNTQSFTNHQLFTKETVILEHYFLPNEDGVAPLRVF